MKVIITGSTGMIGKGVLYECIDDSRVSEILLINRSSVEVENAKVKEVLHGDFSEFDSIKDQLSGYDACFHCMGVSAAGMSEDQYTQITYGVTEALVNILHELNPQMVVNYVSGAGTDSSEKGRSMWGRVKGRTENMVLNKGFRDAYCFRPGAILPERGIKSRTGWYNTMYVIMRPFFSLLKRMKSVTTTTTLGKAMINSVDHPQESKHLDGVDINELSALS